MRLVHAIFGLLCLAPCACAELYAELDSMADQVRATETNFEYSPRITLGFENNDVGTRLRYWHLNTTVDLGAEQPDYSNYRYHFDVLDWDVYKQYSGLRLFGGLRGGFLTFSARSSPASNATPFLGPYPVTYLATQGQPITYVGNYGRAVDLNTNATTIPFFRSSIDINTNGINSYSPPLDPDYTNAISSSNVDSIRSAIFGPTAGLEGDVPIIGNLRVDYGARCSFLLANWYSSHNYSSSYSSYQYLPYYPYYALSQTPYSINSGGRFADTLFVPEIVTGLELRWTYAQLGFKFEVQKWQSDQENYSFQSPTIVGIGGTLTAKY